ncbi:MAG: hypothetical protein IKQ67_06820 [Candidatus Methanomethylophilaceae archaeon]|nr:hypothetical protein [Candidatus Methanomethylophilaceae archaeon]
MIYSSAERIAIRDILERKEFERIVYSGMDSLPIAVKSSFDCEFELDIQRCNAMLRISANDFSNLDSDIEILSPHPI